MIIVRGFYIATCVNSHARKAAQGRKQTLLLGHRQWNLEQHPIFEAMDEFQGQLLEVNGGRSSTSNPTIPTGMCFAVAGRFQAFDMGRRTGETAFSTIPGAGSSDIPKRPAQQEARSCIPVHLGIASPDGLKADPDNLRTVPGLGFLGFRRFRV